MKESPQDLLILNIYFLIWLLVIYQVLLKSILKQKRWLTSLNLKSKKKVIFEVTYYLWGKSGEKMGYKHPPSYSIKFFWQSFAYIFQREYKKGFIYLRVYLVLYSVFEKKFMRYPPCKVAILHFDWCGPVPIFKLYLFWFKVESIFRTLNLGG